MPLLSSCPTLDANPETSAMIMLSAAGSSVGSCEASPLTNVVTMSTAVVISWGAFVLIAFISAVRMAAPCASMAGRLAVICMFSCCSSVGSCADSWPIIANNCPCMLWSSMPRPATNAAMMPAMPMYFMKLPGLKNEPNREPILPNPACSFGPTMSPMPPNTSPNPDTTGLMADFALPATDDSPDTSLLSEILENMPPKPLPTLEPSTLMFESNALVSFPNPTPSLSATPATDWPTSEPAIFAPSSLNGPVSLSAPCRMRLTADANGSPSTARASRISLLKYDLNCCRPVRLDWSWPGICLSFPVSWPIPPSPSLPSVSNTLVILSTLPPTPANNVNAPANWPRLPTMS